MCVCVCVKALIPAEMFRKLNAKSRNNEIKFTRIKCRSKLMDWNHKRKHSIEMGLLGRFLYNRPSSELHRKYVAAFDKQSTIRTFIIWKLFQYFCVLLFTLDYLFRILSNKKSPTRGRKRSVNALKTLNDKKEKKEKSAH